MPNEADEYLAFLARNDAEERRQAEALRLQMERQKSPPFQINNLVALKILTALLLIGAAVSFAASYWQLR